MESICHAARIISEMTVCSVSYSTERFFVKQSARFALRHEGRHEERGGERRGDGRYEKRDDRY